MMPISWYRVFLVLGLLSLAGLGLTSPDVSGSQIIYYVATDGSDDTGNGSASTCPGRKYSSVRKLVTQGG